MSNNAVAELMKARFVGVPDNNGMLDRQIPVEIGEDSELVLQFGDTDMFATFIEITNGTPKHVKEFQSFSEKIKILNDEELNNCLKCCSDDMINLLSTTVSCVGCRRAVETLFQLVSEMEYRTLYPIRLLKCHEHETPCEFTLECDYLLSMKKLFMLLYVFKPQLEWVVNVIPKSRKNKRCNLHCLDSHKVKSIGIWMDFWKSLNMESRDEIVTINIDAFVEALESYLQKHRFCQECRAKVERAYKLLLKDVKPDEKDEEYDDDIFSGIKVCKADRHLHIDCRDDTISGLISRAEPELTNSRRERHAKTMDVAQEEVLTCLGIVLHEKLHKLCQKVKAEEQTWMILINICLECMKRQLVLAVEDKRGYTNMELFLLEHEEETKKKELRKEMKREKKRKKKLARKTPSEGANDSCSYNSTTKDDFAFNEENDDDEDDGEDDEEEREPLKPVQEKQENSREECSYKKELYLVSEQQRSLEELVEVCDEELNSDWQVVENNHCKQCNMRKVTSKSEGMTRSHKWQRDPPCNGKMGNARSPEFDRHMNNNAQSTRWGGGILASKRKSKSSSDVTTFSSPCSCCRGATARSPLKAETSLQPSASANHRNNRPLQKHQVPPISTTSNNNGRRRIRCAPHVLPVSAVKSASSSSLPTTTSPVISHPAENSSSSCSESSCKPVYPENVTIDLPPVHRYTSQARAVKRGGDVSCCQCDSASHSVQSTLVNKGECSTSQCRVFESDKPDIDLPLSRMESSFATDLTCLSTSEEPESGVHLIPEQERQYFTNNWAEIREQRDLLRSKLRQAWSEKTKAIS